MRAYLSGRVWGLRNYGKETETIWDGKPDCQHEWVEQEIKLINENRNGIDSETLDIQGTQQFRKELHGFQKTKAGFCVKCGAWKGQLGLEPTYQMYLDHLLQITAELKRVLKPTGTLWWNHGQTYSSVLGNHGNRTAGFSEEAMITDNMKPEKPIDMPPKCLMQLPERLAIRMVDEQGWTLRNDIVWYKPNHMPSSVEDRLSTSWEHVYLFVKSRKYYFNLDAIREPHIWAKRDKRSLLGRVKGKTGKITEGQYATNAVGYNILGKNPGDVWRITTKPYKGAHFATFPPELPERCIKAGCPQEVCSVCGKPKMPQFVFTQYIDARSRELVENKPHNSESPKYGEYMNLSKTSTIHTGILKQYETEYLPTCNCNADFKAGVVLDPFAGSGTTLMVAMQMHLNAIGIEINSNYIKLIEQRCHVPNNLAYEYELIKEVV